MTDPGTTTILVPLNELAISEQVREKAASETEQEVRLRIDELERSMWIDLARGLPFWSTLVVERAPTTGDSGPSYLIVDGERRFRALRRLRANLDRELANDEWDPEQKQNIRKNIATRDLVPCRVVSVAGAERRGLQFRANKSLALSTSELRKVYRSLFEDYFRRMKGVPYSPTVSLTEVERAKLWRSVAQETGDRVSKVAAIGSLDEFRDSGPNCAELARRALLERTEPDAVDFSWIEEINSLFRPTDWDAITRKVLSGEIRSVATKGGLRDYARAIYSAKEHGDPRVFDVAREGLLSRPDFRPVHAEALSYLGGDYVAKEGVALLDLLAGTTPEQAKTVARTLLQRADVELDAGEPTTEDYHDELVALLYKTGQKLDPRFAAYVPRGLRMRQLVQTLGAFQIKLNEFITALVHAPETKDELPAGKGAAERRKRLDG